ncbi:hypothetical protein BT96DRAFT_967971 [Gymnopus androsaceus JB14]|uniref:DUF1989 domain-containing protein n=1 Tax=Gymnopus androsaceus JB14 TaxID=1447944 RepID=A0A6A4GUE0_9AGAR|nr:hypothetical protein BT96DRAFT_967971 [Gymnopus androsaceus JB14]
MSSKNRLTEAAYQCLPGGPLDIDRAFMISFVLPIRSGKAWEVRKGDICRIIAVGRTDRLAILNIWSLHNPRERFWASRTRQLQRAHVSVYDRLWSTLPYLRPLVTISGDSLKDYGVDGSGIDAEGGRVHDLLGTRCDPYVNRMLTGEDNDYHCHSNLTRAVAPYGLTEFDVHDVLNTCPAKKGDYFEFIAETDILCALSTCPGGDLSKAMWGEGATEATTADPTLECCRPLGVEVYRLPDGWLTERGWKEAMPNGRAYKGGHALKEVLFASTGKS